MSLRASLHGASRWEIIDPMKRIFSHSAALCALILCLFGAPAAAAELTVFAAASLREALDEAAGAWHRPVTRSYGGSGMIARQVAQGAPSDVVLLANSAWMDWLEDNDSLTPGTRTDLLSNALVLVGPAGAPDLTGTDAAALLARLGQGRMAIGETRGVPAGIYGRQWMQAAGLWPALRPRLAETENVRAALALVARGEAPLGLVYASDAIADPMVRVLHRIDPAMHDRVVYPVAAPRGGDAQQAAEFIDFLQTAEASEIFRRHGFAVIGRDP